MEDYIKNCLVCQQTKYSTQASGGYLQPLPTPTAVWEDVFIDFITGMPLSKGFSVVIVVVSRFSKYSHFAALPTSFSAYKVAEVFVEAIIKHHGIPETIVSDRDPIFVSKYWTQLFKLSGTQLNHSTTYHPQTDGQTEEGSVDYYSVSPGSSKVTYVEDELVEQDELMRRLRENLLMAKNQMEEKANLKRREVEFNVGDKILVKL
nr:Ty3/gypsy retrotransposon protein [Tanacetum cinerariifolium]GFA55587.1 Ty3/gypsy retrotransposon protein [Tanacetum cinerariifolium]